MNLTIQDLAALTVIIGFLLGGAAKWFAVLIGRKFAQFELRLEKRFAPKQRTRELLQEVFDRLRKAGA